MNLKNRTSEEKVLLIVDGNNIAYRAKYKFQLSNRGIDVSVTYGFLKMIVPLIREYRVSSVIVAWDGGTPVFRKALVPEYKAERHKDEDPEEHKDFMRQIYELHESALPAMGIVSILKKRIEADDIVYQASKISSEKSIVVSSDKDMLQCVSDKVSVLNPAREKLYTTAMLEEEIGVTVADYVAWRAIQGDGSDGIPGVNGIGEKTATKLFKEYGSLFNICLAAGSGKLNNRIGTAINEFGYNRILNNEAVMDLKSDRLGCRMLISEEVNNWQPSSRVRITNYLLRNGFASLMDTVPGLVSKLVVPILDEEIRYPIIEVERKSL